MTLFKTALALVVAAGLSAAAMAQDSHESHHPAGDSSQAAAPAEPSSSAPSAAAPSGGMMGRSSGTMGGQGMGPGMMSGQTMMGGQGMGPGISETMMPGIDMADRIDGRLAFLKTEIEITDAQSKIWDNFAQALRDNAKKLGDLRTKDLAQSGTPTLSQRLDEQEQWYAARLDGIKFIKATFSPLYAALSDDQKTTANQLLPMNLGLMPMRGMMSQAGQRGGMGMNRGGKP